jgi:predicted Fe-Mo cluster-binding NifX family protein
MRIAIPVAAGKLCMHFGHCEKFSIFDIEDKKITARDELDPPPHEPGLLPVWLAEKGVTNIIAGGMGQRAQTIFVSNNINVTVGASGEAPEDIINDFLSGSLVVGSNVCDH